MVALHARNLSNRCPRVRVQNDDFGSMRQIHTACSTVHRDVVEILAASGCSLQRKFLQEVIAAGWRCNGNENTDSQNAQCNNKPLAKPHKFLLSGLPCCNAPQKLLPECEHAVTVLLRSHKEAQKSQNASCDSCASLWLISYAA